ncbi:MAG: hypothetical protein ACM3SY_11280 [Candidatus Omnitrophota bacterium]
MVPQEVRLRPEANFFIAQEVRLGPEANFFIAQEVRMGQEANFLVPQEVRMGQEENFFIPQEVRVNKIWGHVHGQTRRSAPVAWGRYIDLPLQGEEPKGHFP